MPNCDRKGTRRYWVNLGEGYTQITSGDGLRLGVKPDYIRDIISEYKEERPFKCQASLFANV